MKCTHVCMGQPIKFSSNCRQRETFARSNCILIIKSGVLLFRYPLLLHSLNYTGQWVPNGYSTALTIAFVSCPKTKWTSFWAIKFPIKHSWTKMKAFLMLPCNGNVMFHFCTDLLYSAQKMELRPDVVLEQLYTILTGVYPKRILQSTTTESLLKQSPPVNNYQHFNKFHRCLFLEFSYLLVFILFLCLE